MSTYRTQYSNKLDREHFGRRQPRPASRRQGTRAGVIRAALLEG